MRPAAISRHGGEMSDGGEWLGFVLIIFGGIGWIMNIVAVAQSDVVSGMVILRVVGIFMAPLGAVLGYL